MLLCPAASSLVHLVLVVGGARGRRQQGCVVCAQTGRCGWFSQGQAKWVTFAGGLSVLANSISGSSTSASKYIYWQLHSSREGAREHTHTHNTLGVLHVSHPVICVT